MWFHQLGRSPSLFLSPSFSRASSFSLVFLTVHTEIALTHYKVPEVARELSLLFGGKEIADAKFKRVKPIFELARKSGASTSSAPLLTPLPLDATEPRLELELSSADNLMAIERGCLHPASLLSD